MDFSGFDVPANDRLTVLVTEINNSNDTVKVTGLCQGTKRIFYAEKNLTTGVKLQKSDVVQISTSLFDSSIILEFRKIINVQTGEMFSATDPEALNIYTDKSKKYLYGTAHCSYDEIIVLRNKSNPDERQSYIISADLKYLIFDYVDARVRIGGKSDIRFDKYMLGIGDTLLMVIEDDVVKDVIIIKNQ